MPARPSVFGPRTTTICTQCRQALRRQQQQRRRLASSTSSAASESPEIYDVVTVGGGPAGLALLAALKSSPVTSHLKTALIEVQDLSKSRQWEPSEGQFANRASSLTPSSVAFLEATGAWRHVDQSRVQAYDEMQVWDASNDASLKFDWQAQTRKYNAPPRTVATMTENANLTRGLLERVVELGAESSLMSGTSVSSIANGPDDPEGFDLSGWPLLTLESKTSATTSTPSTIAARLLVGADGFNSPVRSFAGIDSKGWDYGRHGVVATLTVQPPQDSTDADSFDLFSDEPLPNRATAYQRFLPRFGGPIAVLPLPQNRASLVWSTTPGNAAYLKSLSPSAQVDMINAALRLGQTDLEYMFNLPPSETGTETDTNHESELRWRLQHTPAPSTNPPVVTEIQEGSLASFPLRFRHATSLVGPRVALVGDAAHTVHPLAGQGLNLGLADARSLAECVAYAVAHGMDIGDGFALARYSENRFGKGLLMAGGVDVLNSVYQFAGGDGLLSTLASRARGLGMRLVDSDLVPGLKGLIMKQAE